MIQSITPSGSSAAEATSPTADASPKENFLEKCKRIMDDGTFEQFAVMASRDRVSQALLFDDKHNLVDNWNDDDSCYSMQNAHSELAQRFSDMSKGATLLIQDVDQNWLQALDLVCDFDPEFLKAYVCTRADQHKVSADQSDVRGTWYTASIKTLTDSPAATWEVARSRWQARTSEEPSLAFAPWWMEENRHVPILFISEEFEQASKIACYCVSEHIRTLPTVDLQVLLI